MLKQKNFIVKLVLGAISIFLLPLGIVWTIDPITRRLPVPPSQIRLAQEGITQNADWKSTIRHFNSLDWALVPAGCFIMGSTESQLEEALSACRIYGGKNVRTYLIGLHNLILKRVSKNHIGLMSPKSPIVNMGQVPARTWPLCTEDQTGRVKQSHGEKQPASAKVSQAVFQPKQSGNLLRADPILCSILGEIK